MRLIFFFLLLISCKSFSQGNGNGNNGNGNGNCPPGWEKQPEKHPDCMGPKLPVTFISFSAHTYLGSVFLSWKVASEINHSHYLVERSLDAKIFKIIAKPKNYSVIDYPNSQSGLVYYRLSSVDLDGTQHYFNIIAVKVEPGRISRTYTLEGREISPETYNQVIISNGFKVFKIQD